MMLSSYGISYAGVPQRGRILIGLSEFRREVQKRVLKYFITHKEDEKAACISPNLLSRHYVGVSRPLSHIQVTKQFLET